MQFFKQHWIGKLCYSCKKRIAKKSLQVPFSLKRFLLKWSSNFLACDVSTTHSFSIFVPVVNQLKLESNHHLHRVMYAWPYIHKRRRFPWSFLRFQFSGRRSRALGIVRFRFRQNGLFLWLAVGLIYRKTTPSLFFNLLSWRVRGCFSCWR